MSAPHPEEAHMPKPTRRQLAFLRTLATERGMTFAYPQTSAEASQEINRLKRLRPDSSTDQRRERHQIADAIHAGPANTAAHVRGDEITGHGSSARWAHYSQQPAPTTHNAQRTTTRDRPVVGERIELGSYTVNGQRRVIIGQRVNGIVRVSDIPDGKGRAYLIERELDTKAELDAVVSDYLQRAARLGTVPMTVIPVEARR
jgi:hypothetical protein